MHNLFLQFASTQLSNSTLSTILLKILLPKTKQAIKTYHTLTLWLKKFWYNVNFSPHCSHSRFKSKELTDTDLSKGLAPDTGPFLWNRVDFRLGECLNDFFILKDRRLLAWGELLTQLTLVCVSRSKREAKEAPQVVHVNFLWVFSCRSRLSWERQTREQSLHLKINLEVTVTFFGEQNLLVDGLDMIFFGDTYN